MKRAIFKGYSPNSNMKYKQMIVVRKDLKMGKGKMAVQASHASIGAYMLAHKKTAETTKAWVNEGMKKVVVYVNSRKELFDLKEEIPKKIPMFVVSDAGLTQLKPGTVTAMGIGPAENEDLDKYTNHLKLM